jgi:hypothetical protein
MIDLLTMNSEDQKMKESSPETPDAPETPEPPELQISYVQKYKYLILFRKLAMRTQKRSPLTPETSETPVTLFTHKSFSSLLVGDAYACFAGIKGEGEEDLQLPEINKMKNHHPHAPQRPQAPHSRKFCFVAADFSLRCRYVKLQTFTQSKDCGYKFLLPW